MVSDFETLVEIAKTIYNNIISNETWDVIDPKNAQILALTNKVEELQKKLINERAVKINLKNSANISVFLLVLQPWQKVDGVEWW